MIKKRTFAFAIFLLLSLVISSFSSCIFSASAEGIIYLEPIADSYVDSNKPETNFGGSDYLHTSFWDFTIIEDVYRDAWLMFDLSSIPAEATITGANLWLYVWDV
jgi:hypothetical protein